MVDRLSVLRAQPDAPLIGADENAHRKDSRGDANYWTVRLTDQSLFECPLLLGSDVGTIGLAPVEIARLREYLLKGGFLWVDDFWGTRAWDQWADAMRQVLPEYPIFDIPLDHPIRETLFDVSHVPQVPGINFWRASGGGTAERGNDSPQADFRGIADSHGRIMVVMTHNTDIGDSMERESEDPAFFAAFSPRLPGHDRHGALRAHALVSPKPKSKTKSCFGGKCVSRGETLRVNGRLHLT
jgi:hypothetical protein